MPGFLQQLIECDGPAVRTDLFERAMALGRVRTAYAPAARQKETQFVEINVRGKRHYAAIGSPGIYRSHEGAFTLIPAKVVGGRQGIYYFLFLGDFSALLQQKNLFAQMDCACAAHGSDSGWCTCMMTLESAMLRCAAQGGGMIIHRAEHDGGATERMFHPKNHPEAHILLQALGFSEKQTLPVAGMNLMEKDACVQLDRSVSPVIAESDPIGGVPGGSGKRRLL